ncbi:MAG: efflux RND transporter permease subunit, partial [Gammaproteobacteria bacterium]|nr:efflux RND transporter permease subunit [Gammaproteobacteria bacterium]
MLAALVQASLRYRGVVVALAVAMLVYGFFAVRAADLDIFPEFAARQVVVQTEAPGYATGQVETLVTAPLEALLGGLPDLRFLRSESISGLSIITVVFAEDTDVLENRQLVSERLFAAAARLPAGAGAPVVVPLASSSATVRTIGIRSDSISHVELSELVRRAIVPRLISAAGVADVNVFGDARRTLRVEADPVRMRRFGVSFDALVEAIASSAAPTGLGVITTANQELAVELGGGGRPGDIARLIVSNDPASPVSIGDVADVRFGVAPAIGAAQIMTEPGIVMMIIGQYGANTRTVSRNLEPILDELAVRLADKGVTIYPDLFVPARYIETSLKNITGHVMIGGLFVVLVLYAFLYNVRTAFISAVAIPLSLTAAIIVLLKSGINLNIMVLGGLAIALGEVVDDAIIDTENIFRRLRENRAAAHPAPVAKVVFDASMEVRGSVVYATFIVMLAFIPLLTLGGVAGRLVAPLGITYILAIFASLVTALTVTPALCYRLLGDGRLEHDDPPLLRRLIPVYRGALERLLGRPVGVVVVSLVLCAAGLALLPSTSNKFLPELREGHYIVHTASLPGTSLNESIRIGTALTREFLKVPGVRSVSQWAGRAERGADTYGSHYSEYEVALEPLNGREQQRVLEALRRILRAYPGLLFEANTFLTERIDETLTGYTAPLVINIYGNRLYELDRVARDVAVALGAVDGTSGVSIRSTPGTPIVRVTPDSAMLEQLGIAPASVTRLLRGAYD